MKALVLLSLSLSVALALPPFPPRVPRSPSLTKEEQSTLLEDSVPLQGHVVVEHPGPQARLGAKEQQEKMAPGPLGMEQIKSQNMVELEVKLKPDVKGVEQELQAEPGVKGVEDLKPEADSKPELIAEPDFKVEMEAEVVPHVQKETELEEKPVFHEKKEEFQVLMNRETETEIGQEVQERHIDMERMYEMVGEPIMELEPLHDDIFEHKGSNTELSEVEKSLKAAFQNQGPVGEPLLEEKGLIEEGNGLDEKAIMNLEPFLNDEVLHEAAAMEEGPALDIMGHPIRPLEEYYPNQEARMKMNHGKQQESLKVDGLEPESEESQMAHMAPFEGRALEDWPVPDGGARTGQGYCAGVVLEGKCYQFFKGPKRAVDAEFFCQENFPGGHLASITSQHIHKELMNMMLQQNGAYTRTWIGGLRYLETGRFIWLDGSHWVYDDWLSGEPNNSANMEDCVEVLALGNGNFNDFTCWEPQAFICSYHYQ